MSPQQTWIRRTAGLGLAATIALGACEPVQEPEAAARRPVLAAAVVSNPVTVPLSAALSGSAGAPAVYVSLSPGSVPGAEQATIQNPRTGALVTVAMMEGGFDPVAMEASAGDTLDVDIRVAGAEAPLLFAIVVPDRRPPIVVRTDPPPQKRDVPLNAVLLVVFSEPLDSATLTDTSVQLLRDGAPVAGTLGFGDAAHLTVTFTPVGPLAAGAEYTLMVAQGITDLGGDTLEAQVRVEFTTRNEPAPVAAVYERVTPHNLPGYSSRYVLSDDGTFELQYETQGGSFAYRGRYSRPDSILAFAFDDSSKAGPWEATGTLLRDSLTVRYNDVMGWADFDDAVYVRNELEGWASLAPMPGARWQVGVASLNDIVYVAGGVSVQGGRWAVQTAILAYDPGTDVWQSVGTLISPVRWPAMAVVGNRIYVVGGIRDEPSEEPVAELQIFDPATGTVVAGPPMPTPRGGLAVTVLDGRIHAIGGVGAPSDSIGDWSSAHEVYDPATNAWSSRAPLPRATSGHGAVAVPRKIYVAGGTALALQVYDPATDSWTTDYAAPEARFGGAVAGRGGKIYLIGGTPCCGLPSGTTERFDPATGIWEQVASMPTARTGHGVAVVDGIFYVVGGSSTGDATAALAANERFVPK